ncbi:PepSY domain-containing protein [Rummeliibacillus pycnus]|uniref:PepSY domain-containing protein n=1 Tax=Rummeliibacillus pycnus TaxID=101070 RepID=UPI003D267542
MKNWEIVLRDYIIGRPVITIEYDEDDSTVGEIIDAHRELVYGHIELSDNGKLTSFMIDLDEIMENNDVSLDEFEELTPDELIGCAEDFVHEFCRDSLHFNMMTEWNGESYLIVFEAKDVALNLFLPNSGATIEINKQGFIISATLFQSYYQLSYPDIQISADDAKDTLCQYPLVELGINEDNGEMKLAYFPKRDYMAVHVDGHIVSSGGFLEEEIVEARTFGKVTVTETIESLLGVTSDMYLVGKGDSRYWYKAEDGENIEQAEPIIKVEYSDEIQVDYEASVDWVELESELPEKVLEEKAKMFLETVVGNIHEKYLLEDQLEYDDDFDILSEEELSEEERQFFEELEMMEDDEEDFEEEEMDFEPFTTFTFIRNHKGIRIEEYSIHVNVGVYTGIIRDCTILLPNEEKLISLDMNPVLSLEQADAIFKNQIHMKLARTSSYDDEEEEVAVYGLDYIMYFPQGRAIEKIDATTGEIQYTNADILKEGE